MANVDDFLDINNEKVKEIITDIGQILTAREKKALSILTVRQLSRYYDKLAQGVPKEEAFEELKSTSERLLDEREALAKQLQAEYEKAWLWIKGQQLRIGERKEKQNEEIEKRKIFLQTHQEKSMTIKKSIETEQQTWEKHEVEFEMIAEMEPEHWISFKDDYNSYKETLNVYNEHISTKLDMASQYTKKFEEQIIDQTKALENILEEQIIPLENKLKDCRNEREVRRLKKDKHDLRDYYQTELEKLKAAETKSRLLLTSTKDALRTMNEQEIIIQQTIEAAKKRYEHFVEQFKLFMEQHQQGALDNNEEEDDLPPEEDEESIDDDLFITDDDDDDDLPPDDDDLPPEDDDDLPPEDEDDLPPEDDDDLPPNDISSTMSDNFFINNEDESSEDPFTDFSDVNEEALLQNLPSDEENEEEEEENLPLSDEEIQEKKEEPILNESPQSPNNEEKTVEKDGQFHFSKADILKKYSFDVIKFGRRVRKKKSRVWSIDIPNQRVVTSSQKSKRACKIIPVHHIIQAIPDVVHHQLVNVYIRHKKKSIKAALYFNSAGEREMFLQAIAALKGLPLYSSYIKQDNILVQGYKAADIKVKKLKGSPFGKFAKKETMSSIPVSHKPTKNISTFVGLWNPSKDGELPTNPEEIRDLWLGSEDYTCIHISIVNMETMSMTEYKDYFQNVVGNNYICLCSTSGNGLHNIVFLHHLSFSIFCNVFTDQVAIPKHPQVQALITSVQFFQSRLAFITTSCSDIDELSQLYSVVMNTKLPENSKLLAVSHDHLIWSLYVPSKIALDPKEIQKRSMKMDQILDLRTYDELQQKCDQQSLLWGFFEPDLQGFPPCTTPPAFNSRIFTYSREPFPIEYTLYSTTRKTCNSIHRFLKADIAIPCRLPSLGKLLPDDPLSHFHPSIQFESIDVVNRQPTIERPILDIMSTFTTKRHVQTQPIKASANPSWQATSLPSHITIHSPSIDFLRTQQIIFNIFDGRQLVSFARFELFPLFVGLPVIPSRDDLMDHFKEPIRFELPLSNVKTGLPEGALEGSFSLVY